MESLTVVVCTPFLRWFCTSSNLACQRPFMFKRYSLDCFSLDKAQQFGNDD